MIRKPTTRIPQFRRLCKEITIAQKSQFLEMRSGQSKPFISESTQFRNVKHLVAISIRGCNILYARDWLGFKFVFVFVFVCTCIRICIVLCVQQKQWEIPACPRPVCPLDFEHGWSSSSSWKSRATASTSPPTSTFYFLHVCGTTFVSAWRGWVNK